MPEIHNKLEKYGPFPSGVSCAFLFSCLGASLLFSDSFHLSIFISLSHNWWTSQSIHPMVIFPLIYNTEHVMSILPKPPGFPIAHNSMTVILTPFSLIPHQNMEVIHISPLSLSSPIMKWSLKPGLAF